MTWGNIFGRNPDKSPKSFRPCYSQSPLLFLQSHATSYVFLQFSSVTVHYKWETITNCKTLLNFKTEISHIFYQKYVFFFLINQSQFDTHHLENLESLIRSYIRKQVEGIWWQQYPAAFFYYLQCSVDIFLFRRTQLSGILYSSFKGTVSWDRFQNFWQKFTELGLTKGHGWFLNFLEPPMILKRKKYIYLVNASLNWLNNG